MRSFAFKYISLLCFMTGLLCFQLHAGYAQSWTRLPIIEIPTQQGSQPGSQAADAQDKPMALLITGDGGWKTTDKQLCDELAQQGIPVVALNALKYFWSKKTPEQTTSVVEQLMKHYMEQWHKNKVILMGFSFGADVLPFVVNRLDSSLYHRLIMIVMLSPGTSTDFEIHVSQMLNSNKQWKYNVVDEIRRMPAHAPVLCFFGDEEHIFPVNQLPASVQVIYLKGGHHYEENKINLAKEILMRLPAYTQRVSFVQHDVNESLKIF
ncbi:virulence protein VirJ [Thermoflavifilum aggregans]|uniref:Virulence protein VirJ n=2 Tax=Thermoflavifilum aggregans TaxID=454188 RepID=A0A2M9CU17_9BACT|nr:virulence protein VirJ [Thermoflavifilum aggregans]